MCDSHARLRSAASNYASSFERRSENDRPPTAPAESCDVAAVDIPLASEVRPQRRP